MFYNVIRNLVYTNYSIISYGNFLLFLISLNSAFSVERLWTRLCSRKAKKPA